MRNLLAIIVLALFFVVSTSGIANAYNFGEIKGTAQTFDEKKTENCSAVNRVIITSTFADVNVSISNTSETEVHLYGEAILDGELKFEVRVINRELRITVYSTGNCFNGNLQMDVIIPQKTYEVIYIKGASADIILNEGVITNHLKVNTQSGDVESAASVNVASVATMSGDVELYIAATRDISVEASSMSGDVSAMFDNIEYLNLSVSSMSGELSNQHRGRRSNGFVADVEICTMSGDITIR